ncbi:MAG: hypothetical protein KDD40_09630 [Bdellovibrionales bacterium]|nr:hypothetical protein [Bdellovibrionales bacterium]
MKRMLMLVIFLSFTFQGMAEEVPLEAKAVSFNKWKQLQVVEAQNKVVRLSNLLLLLKSEKYTLENSLPQVANESKQDIQIPEKQQQELIGQTEGQLKTAVASLDFAKELTLNDYFSVYLRQFKDNKSALEALAQDMDKSEIAEVLSSLISVNSSPVSVDVEENKHINVVSKQPTHEKDAEKRSPSKL